MPVPYSAASDALAEYRQRREEREMREALLEDGRKLRQMTGQDHGPEFQERMRLATCPACGGDGADRKLITVYENGCGFPHSDVYETTCAECGGVGEIVVEEEGDES